MPLRIRAGRASSRLPRPRRSPRRARATTDTGPSQRKLLQEPQVVLVEEADILDAPLEEREPLDADAKREAGVAFGVVADGFEHGGMDHAAAEDLDPAG